MGVVILAIVTYAYTRSWIQTSLITFIHHFVFLWIFFGHERLWLRFGSHIPVKRRSLFKMLTYETFLGNVVLATISYLVTGCGKSMTAITITYIGIKHIVYFFNELVWVKIKAGVIR